MYDLSDSQTAEAVRFDIRWKVACGCSLSEMSFDPSTLGVLAAAHRCLQAPGSGVRCGGGADHGDRVLRGRRKRCVKATVFEDAVATQDTVTQSVAAIGKVARVVPGAGRGDRPGVHAGLLLLGQATD